MQLSSYQPPATAEDAVMATLLALGRRMRVRLPDDTVDFSVVPILKTLKACGPMRLSGLATALELDASTVSRHVKQLEDRGLLARTSDPDDGRASQIVLSDAGDEVVHKHIARRKGLIGAALEGWSDDDREALRTILDRLNRELHA
jgi:DNA-binding MarR family transcriptional regulator